MNVILPLLGFFALGVLARAFVPNPALWVKWINNFIIYIAFPAIIFNKVPSLELSANILIPASFAWAWALIAIALVFIISRAMKLRRETTGALLILTTMGNTSFLGYALTSTIFGDGALAYAIFYDQFGSFFILSTLGLIIIARYTPVHDQGLDGIGSPPTMLEMGKRIISFPPFLTLCVAIFLPIEPLVEVVLPVTQVFASSLMPLALFVIGLQFQMQLLPQHRKPLAIGLALKMVLAPMLALAVFEILNIKGDIRIATVFEAAMPSMITPGLLAINAGIAPRFVATFLGYGTVFALFSLPIVVYFL